MKKLIFNRSNLIFIAIFIIAAALRLVYLSDTPPWYTDEGFYLNVSWEIIHGNYEIMGVGDWTFISPYFTTPPLYLYIIGLLSVVFGKTLLVTRLFSVVIGLATIFSLYVIGKKIFSPKHGLLIAAVYALLPEFILNNRWAFPHGLAGLLVLWWIYLFWRYLQNNEQKYLLCSILLLATANLVTYWTWPLFIVMPFILWRRIRIKSIFYSLLSLLPLLLLISWRLAVIPEIFISDLRSLVSGDVVLDPHPSILIGFIKFYTMDVLFFLSFIGLFLIKDKVLKWLILSVYLMTSLPILIYRWNPVDHFYPNLIFTPVLLIGVGAIFLRLGDTKKIFNIKITKILLPLLIAYLSIWTLISGAMLADKSLARIISDRPFIVAQSVGEMKEVASYINNRSSSEDYVIAPNNLNWQLKARTTTLVWTACYENMDDFNFIWPERYSWQPSIAEAKYYVHDRYFGGDASVCKPYRQEIIDTMVEQNWSVVYSTERFDVHANPQLAE
ncbi:glycosyltransferase family 39 protein [Patescibacteria group bacterium]